MKNTIIIFLLTTFFTTNLFCQGKRGERVKAMKVAFLTDKLQLSPEESEKFWPLYNELDSKSRELRKEARNRDAAAELSDQEALDQIEKQLQREEKQIALKRTYLDKLSKVVSPKKLLILPRAEKAFKKEIIKQARMKRENGQGRAPGGKKR